MSYIETYNILNKLWLDTKDIQELLNCGKESARKVRDEVAKIIRSKGYELPVGKCKKVATKEVIEYLGLDIDYIINMANLEMSRDRIENYANISR